jgi:hypothetical protein
MSYPVLIESCNCHEIPVGQRPGFRILLMLLSIFPLIAPYKLIVRIDWQDYFHPFFLPAAFISAGAVWLSLFLIFAPLTGLNSQIVFNKKTSTPTYSFEAPLVRRIIRIYPLSAINSIDVGKRSWSDGVRTYPSARCDG